MRRKSIILNSLAGIVCQLTNIVCGFLLPAAILKAYGSAQYGLTNSINNFLGLITLCELGIGTVVQSSLYKPLAENDIYKVSCVMKSARRFFKIVASILFVYVVALCGIYPFLIKEFDAPYIIFMIVALSINSFSTYYFGICSSLFLYASKKSFIPLGLQAIGAVISTTLALILIRAGFSLLFLKYATAMLLLFRPAVMYLYVKRNYSIDWNVTYTEEPIKQKWNGVAQHIASVVVDRTDVVVLTLFSNLQAVSIYGVYAMVVSNIRGIIESALSGIQAEMGDLYSRNKIGELNGLFGKIEWIVHTIIIFLYTVTGIMITSFVAIYTRDVNDANYYVPLFSILIVIAYGGFSIQTIYKTIVKAAGQYKETQLASIVEAAINVVTSIVLVTRFGLPGVAVGTIMAMMFRLIYHVIYIHNNIIFRKYRYFFKQLFVDLCTVGIIVIISKFVTINDANYLTWCCSAVIVCALSAIVILLLNLIFYPKSIRYLLDLLISFRKKETK